MCLYLSIAGVWLKGILQGWDRSINLFNVYRPYQNKEVLWDKIQHEGILKKKNIILGGDLNFTLSAREVWGSSTCIDPLVDYFSRLISFEGLVDVEPPVLCLTWSNG